MHSACDCQGLRSHQDWTGGGLPRSAQSPQETPRDLLAFDPEPAVLAPLVMTPAMRMARAWFAALTGPAPKRNNGGQRVCRFKPGQFVHAGQVIIDGVVITAQKSTRRGRLDNLCVCSRPEALAWILNMKLTLLQKTARKHGKLQKKKKVH